MSSSVSHHGDSVPLVSMAASAPSAEQQRITGQEGRDHQAGLGEHHQEHDGVDPDIEARQQLDQVAVQVQDEIQQEVQQFHVGGFFQMRRSRAS